MDAFCSIENIGEYWEESHHVDGNEDSPFTDFSVAAGNIMHVKAGCSVSEMKQATEHLK